MKAVGWLRMNLSMLQMTIQGLEMQMIRHSPPFSEWATWLVKQENKPRERRPPLKKRHRQNHHRKLTVPKQPLWPWQMMQQMREQLQQSAEAVVKEMTPEAAPENLRPAVKNKLRHLLTMNPRCPKRQSEIIDNKIDIEQPCHGATICPYAHRQNIG